MSNIENRIGKTPAAIEKQRENLELKANIRAYIENGGHWSDLIHELGLEEFGENGVLNDTQGGADTKERAKRITSLAMERKTANNKGEAVTPELVRSAIEKLSGSKANES